MFQGTMIKFLKLMKLRRKQQPERGLLRLVPSFSIELGWYVTKHVIQIKQLRFM